MEIEIALRDMPEWARKFDDGLEIIQTLLPTIEFGRYNFGCLVKSKDTYHIVHKHLVMPIITEIPWLTLVDEREIDIRGWAWQTRFGVWNGAEVDLFIAWDASWVEYLDKLMRGHRLLLERNLEHLTYPALGHVLRKGTSEIYGLITAPARGRIFEHTDRSVVYKAIAQIERAGLLFKGIELSNIMLTEDGQVRLLSLSALTCQSADAAKRAEESEYWHWNRLDTIFKELEQSANPIPPLRDLKLELLRLPEFPSPMKGPIFNVYITIKVHSTDCASLPDLQQDDAADAGAVQPYTRRPFNEAEVEFEVEMQIFDDSPMSARSLRAPRTKILARAVPYRKPDKLIQELIRAQNWQRGNTLKPS
ncbi:hypothetical protein C8R43DRAFT_1001982 [Mycena crocata]|nr:hypothetical protein C8R43DRAFT_1001982 [Mycena crocata]